MVVVICEKLELSLCIALIQPTDAKMVKISTCLSVINIDRNYVEKK